jgi:hypothetical protein
MADLPLKKSKNYVDNQKLYDAFVTWYAAREKAEAEGKPEPEPPRYISEAILLIPKHLATKGNFAGYSFREEMIGDAVEDLIKGYRNFDSVKYKSPFAYFTQISYYAFIRRILRERKQSYVKHKLIQNSDILDSLVTQAHDDDGDFRVSMIETMQMNLNPDLEAYYEKKKPVGGKKKKEKSVEDLMGIVDEETVK